MTCMRAFIDGFQVQKAGNDPKENEDAWCSTGRGEFVGQTLRAAVADGATEGILSGAWAHTLVRTFCRSPFDPIADVRLYLERAYRAWKRWRRLYVRRRATGSRPIQWYEEPGLASGAFSSILGLILEAPQGEALGKWRAVAAGDSCLVQVRGNKVVHRFPVERAEGFNNRPRLLCSHPSNDTDPGPSYVLKDGTWMVDDTFFLMTDALAHWLYREHEAGKASWAILRDFGTDMQRVPFSEWIQLMRNQGSMRNDDVTLLRIDLAG